MKPYFTILFLAFLAVYSCDSDDIQEEAIADDLVSNKIELLIDGQPSTNRVRGLSAFVCCDTKINISFDNLVDLEDGGYYGGSGMYLQLDRNGNLLSLWYKSYGPNRTYYSPYFDPTSTLTITDFEFIEDQILKVHISGQMFRSTYNFFETPESATIDAQIEIKDFHMCNCNTYTSNISNSNDFIFDGLSRARQGDNIRYYSNTNNGYQLKFSNFDELFVNMPLGVYAFDENSTTQRIDFGKYIGVPRAFVNLIIPEEWLQYKTTGNFEIIEKVRIGNNIVTKVKFDLIAKDNDEVVFEFNDLILQTQL